MNKIVVIIIIVLAVAFVGTLVCYGLNRNNAAEDIIEPTPAANIGQGAGMAEEEVVETEATNEPIDTAEPVDDVVNE